MKKKLISCIIASFLFYSVQSHSEDLLKSDKWIEGRIQGVLDFNKYSDSSDIDVTYNSGVLDLRGEVPTEEEKEFAEKVSKRISGCTKLNSYIKVNKNIISRSKTDLEQYLSDAALNLKVSTMIGALKIYENSIIKAQTDRGIIVLTGLVPDEETARLAEKIALSVTGVRLVSNQLKPEDTEVLADKIEALSRKTPDVIQDAWITSKVKFFIANSAEMAGSDVIVATKNGEIHLKGQLKNSNQKKYLSEILQLISGVQNIHNLAVVKS